MRKIQSTRFAFFQNRKFTGRPGRRWTAAGRLAGFLVTITCTVASLADDRGLTLTAEEFEANLSFRERSVELLPQASDPLAPRIIIERPDIGAEVATPVDVFVSFVPAEDAEIDLATLKIRYGWFDITERVVKSMTVSATGIEGKINSMRDGRYALKMSISDTLQRESSANIVFEVVEP